MIALSHPAGDFIGTSSWHSPLFCPPQALRMADAESKRRRPELRILTDKKLPRSDSTSLLAKTPARALFPTEQLGNTPLDASCIIDDFLWLGSEPLIQKHTARLKELGMTTIINAAEECTDERGLSLATDFHYHKLGCRDTPNCVNIESAVERAVYIIGEAERTHSRVYVHCHAGKSRSVTLAICYLIRSRQMSLRRAYDYVKTRRPEMSPNIGFIQVMRKWETHCLGVAQNSM